MEREMILKIFFSSKTKSRTPRKKNEGQTSSKNTEGWLRSAPTK